MDQMPVTDQGQHEQQKCNQKKPGGLRSIHSMAVMPMRVAMGLLGGWHAPIVAPKTVN